MNAKTGLFWALLAGEIEPCQRVVRAGGIRPQ